MKHAKSITFIFGAFIFLMMSTAQTNALDWRTGFDLNMTDPQSNLHDRYSTEFGFNFRNEVLFNSYLGMSTGLGYRDFQRTRHGDDSDLCITNIYLNGLGAYTFLEKWRGFVEVGMGMYIWEADSRWWSNGGSGQSMDLGYNFGSGVSYQVSDSIELYSRISRHRVKFDKANDYSRWLEYAVGIQFKIL